ncbi:hypothetical protein DFH06DRAFT_1125528 [Mycena polygramma]|nr:hypothetical protein DFH06DRAFT_1125528 [Mycena polygramma]
MVGASLRYKGRYHEENGRRKLSFPLHQAALLETWTARPPGNAQLLLKPPPLLFRDLTRRALGALPHHVWPFIEQHHEGFPGRMKAVNSRIPRICRCLSIGWSFDAISTLEHANSWCFSDTRVRSLLKDKNMFAFERSNAFTRFQNSLNAEPDLRFGSANATATEPDFGPVQVRFAFSSGSEPNRGNTSTMALEHVTARECHRATVAKVLDPWLVVMGMPVALFVVEIGTLVWPLVLLLALQHSTRGA